MFNIMLSLVSVLVILPFPPVIISLSAFLFRAGTSDAGTSDAGDQ